MNNADICRIMDDGEFDVSDRKVLRFIFNHPIEKIHDAELRTVAITTRQSFEILFAKLLEIIEAGKNSHAETIDPVNNQSA